MAKEDKAKVIETELIQLEKNGESIEAHPDQVPLWIAQGWAVIE